jgi:hypothetical protein
VILALLYVSVPAFYYDSKIESNCTFILCNAQLKNVSYVLLSSENILDMVYVKHNYKQLKNAFFFRVIFSWHNLPDTET